MTSVGIFMLQEWLTISAARRALDMAAGGVLREGQTDALWQAARLLRQSLPSESDSYTHDVLERLWGWDEDQTALARRVQRWSATLETVASQAKRPSAQSFDDVCQAMAAIDRELLRLFRYSRTPDPAESGGECQIPIEAVGSAELAVGDVIVGFRQVADLWQLPVLLLGREIHVKWFDDGLDPVNIRAYVVKPGLATWRALLSWDGAKMVDRGKLVSLLIVGELSTRVGTGLVGRRLTLYTWGVDGKGSVGFIIGPVRTLTDLSRTLKAMR